MGAELCSVSPSWGQDTQQRPPFRNWFAFYGPAGMGPHREGSMGMTAAVIVHQRHICRGRGVCSEKMKCESLAQYKRSLH